MTPLVSILIPAYNAEAWIGGTIRSALAQTWPSKEIIVVDDGSADRTLAVAREFASADVKVVSQQNQGASAARNTAYELCQGDYVQWLDADDLLHPDKIRLQLMRTGVDLDRRALLSCGFASFFHRVSKATFQPSPLWVDLSPTEWLIRKMGQNLHMQTATWLVTREISEAAGQWDTRLSLDDDGEYFSRALLASSGVRFVSGAVVYYRASGYDSLSVMNSSSAKLQSQFLSMQLHVRYLLSLEDSERTRAACLRYLQTWYIFFLAERPDLVVQLQQLAQSLGGRLVSPPIRSKYKWIEYLFGYTAAKRSQLNIPRLRWSLVRKWDKLLSAGERLPVNVAPPSSSESVQANELPFAPSKRY